MRISRRHFVMIACWFASISTAVFAQMSLQSSELGGGGSIATDGNSIMTGTIGQTIIGEVLSDPYALKQGFWYTIPIQLISGVRFNPGVAGSGVLLHQNMPNPFSTTTAISFDLVQAGHVSLKLYNAIGQEVRTLVDDVRETGRTTITVNAGELESGRYTARLVANGCTRTISMVVVR